MATSGTIAISNPVSELEMLEGLEQLRFLVAGIPVAVVDVETPPFALRELNNPEDVARSVLHVLTQPPGCHVYELVVASMWEDSWPA